MNAVLLLLSVFVAPGMAQRWPYEGIPIIISDYGHRNVKEGSPFHRGLDFVPASGNASTVPIRAVFSGDILRISETDRGGWTLVIQDSKQRSWSYMHLFSMPVVEAYGYRWALKKHYASNKYYILRRDSAGNYKAFAAGPRPFLVPGHNLYTSTTDLDPKI